MLPVTSPKALRAAEEAASRAGVGATRSPEKTRLNGHRRRPVFAYGAAMCVCVCVCVCMCMCMCVCVCVRARVLAVRIVRR